MDTSSLTKNGPNLATNLKTQWFLLKETCTDTHLRDPYVCDGLASFRHFCHLSCLILETVTAHCLEHSIFVLMSVGSRSTSLFALHGTLLVCIVTKSDLTETVLVVIMFLTSLSETIQREGEFLAVLWVLV